MDIRWLAYNIKPDKFEIAFSHPPPVYGIRLILRTNKGETHLFTQRFSSIGITICRSCDHPIQYLILEQI
jgi:hypothetical protein